MDKVAKTLLPLIIIVHSAITVMVAYKLNIWIDEGSTLRATENDLFYTLNQALYSELQPPLYYILLNLWRNLNSSIFFARLFSVLSMSLCVYLAGKLSACYLKEIHPGWMAAVVAFNPFSIWAATEIRPYAFVIFLSALLLYSFYKGFCVSTSRKSVRYFYLAIAVMALYTHYYLGFILVANAFCLFFMKQWRSLRIYLLGMIPVSLCFGPMLFIILEQVKSHPGLVQTAHSLFKSLTIVGFRIMIYILPINKQILSSSSYYEKEFLYYVPFCIVLGYFFIKRIQKIKNSQAMPILIILCILSVFFALIHQISYPELFKTRHTTVLFLPALFTVFSIILVIGKRRFLYFIICLVLIIHASTLYSTYKSHTKIGDYKRVSDYIMQHEHKNQAILTFRSEIAIPLSYYYTGPNIIVPIPVEHIPAHIRKQTLNSEKEIFEAFYSNDGSHKNFWITTDTYTYNDRYLNITFNSHILEQFIDKYCVVIKSARFKGSYVRFVRFNKKKYLQTNKFFF